MIRHCSSKRVRGLKQEGRGGGGLGKVVEVKSKGECDIERVKAREEGGRVKGENKVQNYVNGPGHTVLF